MSVAERPTPDGRLTEVDAWLKDADPETLRRATVEMFRERKKNPPLPGAVAPPRVVSVETSDPAAAPTRVFAAADLFASPQAVWHTMPNGARVAVHPLSVVEAIRLNAQAGAAFKKLPTGLAE